MSDKLEIGDLLCTTTDTDIYILVDINEKEYVTYLIQSKDYMHDIGRMYHPKKDIFCNVYRKLE